MADKKKLVDTKQYCDYLMEPPVADEKMSYQGEPAEKFYICALDAKPCIARYLADRTRNSDVFSYFRPEIEEESLKKCQLRNLPKDLAKQVRITSINTEKEKEIVDLERRLECLE